MTRRIRRATHQPLAVATLIDLLEGYISDLEGYLSDENPRAPLQAAVDKALRKVDPNKATTRTMLRNFAKAPADEKIRVFGDFVPGRLRTLSESQFRQIFTPSLTALFADDVFKDPPPDFPSGTQFTIEYTGLYCASVTGDRGLFGASDEPYVITAAVHIENGENIVRTVSHPVGIPNKRYGNVDSGEWQSGPIAACWVGTVREVSLVSIVMEHDEGDPDAYRKQVEAIVETAAAISVAYGYPIPETNQNLVADSLLWLIDSEDDEVGTDVIMVSPLWLRSGASNVPVNYIGTRTVPKPIGLFHFIEEQVTDVTNLPYSFVGSHADDGKYYVTYRVTADNAPSPSRQSFLDLSRHSSRKTLRNN